MDVERNIWSIIFRTSQPNRQDYKRVERYKEKNPDKATTSTRYGIISLVLLIIGVIASCLEFLIIEYICWPIFVYGFTSFHALLGNLFIIAFAIIPLAIPFYLIGYSRKYAAMQMRLNDRKIGGVLRILGIIAVVVAMLCVILSAILTLKYYVE